MQMEIQIIISVYRHTYTICFNFFYSKEGTIRIKLCLKLYFPCAECSELSIVFQFLSLSFFIIFFLSHLTFTNKTVV